MRWPFNDVQQNAVIVTKCTSEWISVGIVDNRYKTNGRDVWDGNRKANLSGIQSIDPQHVRCPVVRLLRIRFYSRISRIINWVKLISDDHSPKCAHTRFNNLRRVCYPNMSIYYIIYILLYWNIMMKLLMSPTISQTISANILYIDNTWINLMSYAVRSNNCP